MRVSTAYYLTHSVVSRLKKQYLSHQEIELDHLSEQGDFAYTLLSDRKKAKLNADSCPELIDMVASCSDFSAVQNLSLSPFPSSINSPKPRW